ncbi:MAG: Plug domain-containing protein, partial [Bacteroidota bacterium]
MKTKKTTVLFGAVVSFSIAFSQSSFKELDSPSPPGQFFLLPSSTAGDSPAPQDSSQPVLLRGTAYGDPWTIYRLTQKEIRQFSVREIGNYLPLIPGVSQVNGALHIRSDRDGSPTYLLDGFNVTSPLDNSAFVSLIPEAIDELQIHTGAYGAEFGRSTAGIVLSRMRTGSDTLQFGLKLLSDDMGGPDGKALGTTVFGYRNIVLTAGGPVFPGLKFFVAGQHNFMRDRQPMFLDAFRFDSLRVDNTSSRYRSGMPADSQALLPGAIDFRTNSIPGNKLEDNTVQGNVTLDLGGLRFQVLGSYENKQT